MIEKERDLLWDEYIKWLESVGSSYDDVYLDEQGSTIVYIPEKKFEEISKSLPVKRYGLIKIDTATGEKMISLIVPDKFQDL